MARNNKPVSKPSKAFYEIEFIANQILTATVMPRFFRCQQSLLMTNGAVSPISVKSSFSGVFPDFFLTLYLRAKNQAA
jgi:hypothetical protein